MSAQFYKPERRDRSRSRLLYMTSLVIIVFLLDFLAGGRLRAAVRTGTSYTYLTLHAMSAGVFSANVFTDKAAILKENESLRHELEMYRAQSFRFAAEAEENTRLRALVGLSEKIPGKAASIISSLYASAYGTFTIDAGVEDGVANNAIVYSPDGFAIGRVTSAGQHTSLVTQLFAPSATIEAVVGETHVVLEGQGGGNARTHASRESNVAEKTIVRSPEIGAPIGIVEHVVSEATGAYTDLYIRIPANFEVLTDVYVGGK